MQGGSATVQGLQIAGQIWPTASFYKQFSWRAVTLMPYHLWLRSCHKQLIEQLQQRPNGPKVQSTELVALPKSVCHSQSVSLCSDVTVLGVHVYGCVGGPSQGTGHSIGTCTYREPAGWTGGRIRQLQGRGRWDLPR